MNDQNKSDCFAAYAGFSVGGERLGMLATITNISRHRLSQNSFVFMLNFEDESLPEALRTQTVTFPQNLGWFEKYTDF